MVLEKDFVLLKVKFGAWVIINIFDFPFLSRLINMMKKRNRRITSSKGDEENWLLINKIYIKSVHNINKRF